MTTKHVEITECDALGCYFESTHDGLFSRCGVCDKDFCENCIIECFECGEHFCYSHVEQVANELYCEECISAVIRVCYHCGESFNTSNEGFHLEADMTTIEEFLSGEDYEWFCDYCACEVDNTEIS